MSCVATLAVIREDHRLTQAGWSYRAKPERGWIIYCDPVTRLWHPRDEAIRILEQRSNRELPSVG